MACRHYLIRKENKQRIKNFFVQIMIKFLKRHPTALGFILSTFIVIKEFLVVCFVVLLFFNKIAPRFIIILSRLCYVNKY